MKRKRTPGRESGRLRSRAVCQLFLAVCAVSAAAVFLPVKASAAEAGESSLNMKISVPL